MAETQIVAAKEEHRYYPYSGVFFVTRRSFWQAGQDSYTQPPAQNPDMFTKLTNVEPVTNGILQRRRGYTLFSQQAPTTPYSLGYSFRNDLTGARDVVFTSPSSVLATDESGNNISSPLFTPSGGAVTPRMVLSRNFGYFADGIVSDNKKWDGSALTNWGISVSNVSALTFGPDFCGTATSLAGSGQAWTTPSAAQGACDGVTAGVSLNASHPGSNSLQLGNFGFAIGSGLAIQGIQVTITYTANYGFGGSFTIQPTLNGTTGSGQRVLLPKTTATLSAFSFGGFTNLLGLTGLTPAQINSANFGFLVSGGKGNQPLGGASVDCISVIVFTAPSAVSVGVTGGGSINLLSGRTYFYAFENSQTGAVSNLSQASVSTGPLTNQNVPLSNIPTNLDPQVDTTLILATADGNDQTTLFLVAALSNGTSTFTDNLPDTTLLTQPLYQNTDAFGILHGVANNNPPPKLLFPVKHKGRIYGANGSTLYFSKNLDEVTTANGLTTSKWEEAWPAANQLDISETAETIRGLLSDGETLWIATERTIRRLIGDSPQNFQKPEVQFNETGIFNQDVWKVVFYEGQPVGTMWLTPDLRVISSDFNTYRDVGWEIQDVLNSVNLSATFGPQASFVSKGPADYFMLYLPTGSNNSPDTVCVYNLRTQKWFVWIPTDQVPGSLFFIDATGAPRWLFSSAAGNIYEWVTSANTDRVGVSSTSYPVTIQTSWLDFGDSNLRKALNQLLYLGQTRPSITIEGAILDLDLDVAPQVVLPATPINLVGPLQDLYLPLAATASQHRWYRFTFVSQSFEAADVLDGFSIESVGLFRY